MEEDLKELQELLTISKRKRVQQILRNHITQLETKIAATKVAQPIKTIPKAASSGATRKIMRFRNLDSYYWVETTSTLKVFVDLDDLTDLKSKYELTFPSSRSIQFRIYLGTRKNYQFKLGNLHGELEDKKDVVRLKKGKIILFLKKKKNEKWYSLKKKKDEFKDPPKMDKDEDPQAGIMKLMKDMYDKGDDEMKRTIAKTMYESRFKKKGDPMDDAPKMDMPDMSKMDMPDMSNMDMPDFSKMDLPKMDDLDDGDNVEDIDDLPDLDFK